MENDLKKSSYLISSNLRKKTLLVILTILKIILSKFWENSKLHSFIIKIKFSLSSGTLEILKRSFFISTWQISSSRIDFYTRVKNEMNKVLSCPNQDIYKCFHERFVSIFINFPGSIFFFFTCYNKGRTIDSRGRATSLYGYFWRRKGQT